MEKSYKHEFMGGKIICTFFEIDYTQLPSLDRYVMGLKWWESVNFLVQVVDDRIDGPCWAKS